MKEIREIKDAKEVVKIFKEKASRYVEVNRKRKTAPNMITILDENYLFNKGGIWMSIDRSNSQFSINLAIYPENSDNAEDQVVSFSQSYSSEDFESSVTTKELLEIMMYDIESSIEIN